MRASDNSKRDNVLGTGKVYDGSYAGVIGFPRRPVFCAHYGDEEPSLTLVRDRAPAAEAIPAARRRTHFGMVVFANESVVDILSESVEWDCEPGAQFGMTLVRDRKTQQRGWVYSTDLIRDD